MHALHLLPLCARPVRASTVSIWPAMLVALAACNPGGGSGGGGAELEFRGEQPLLPGLELDSGWQPEGLPVAVRTTVTAGGAVTVVAHATSDGQQLSPVAGSGSLAIEGELTLEVSARVDALSFEDVVESFGYAIEAEQTQFEPFAIDMPVSLASALPAQELGRVPVPGAPGATLVFSVTGGELTTAFAGTCAAARDGFAQYAGTLTMDGTVTAAATIEVDIPFVITESYGPFELDLPIPPISTALDLGTFDAASGEPVADMGVCNGMGGSTGEDPSVGDDDTGTPGDAGDSGTSGEPGDSSDPDDDGSSTAPGDDGSGSEDSGASPDEDPDYPSPLDGDCAVGTIAVTAEGIDGGVCIPECGDDDACPSGATGNAIGVCSFNPQSSYNQCFTDIDCVDTGVAGEICFADAGVCSLQPSHCILGCDDAHACPDSMTCEQGACFYLE